MVTWTQLTAPPVISKTTTNNNKINNNNNKQPTCFSSYASMKKRMDCHIIFLRSSILLDVILRRSWSL